MNDNIEVVYNGTRINIIIDDITLQTTEAIVNAANRTLLGGGGVDGAIHRAGGPKILKECIAIRQKQGECKTGEAVLTSAGDLNAKFVIHTVGPIWNQGKANESKLLENTYRNSLKIALENNIKTISFPSISTGAYRYPIEEACIIALKTIKDFLDKESFDEIRIVLFSEKDFSMYKRVIYDIFNK